MSVKVPYTGMQSPRVENGCWCHHCINAERATKPTRLPFHYSWMVLCPECGNKRCPKANHHDHACTHSNEPGQKGSAYE